MQCAPKNRNRVSSAIDFKKRHKKALDILSKNGCFISYCYCKVGQKYLMKEKLLF